MLQITRRLGESLIINDGEIKIQVLSIQGNQVRLGIVAPKTVLVDREEIHNMKKLQE